MGDSPIFYTAQAREAPYQTQQYVWACSLQVEPREEGELWAGPYIIPSG